MEEEGLGLTFNLGIQNINQQLDNLSTFCITDSKERSTQIIPTLGLIMSTLRNPRYRGSNVKAIYSSINPAVEGLVTAACSYGSRIRYGKDGMMSSVGDPIRKLLNANQNGTKSKSSNDEQVDEMELVNDDIIRVVDEEEDNDSNNTNDMNITNMSPISPAIPSNVSLAGLLNGMWEGAVALQGINIGSYLGSSTGFSSSNPLLPTVQNAQTTQVRSSSGPIPSNNNNNEDEDIEDFD